MRSRAVRSTLTLLAVAAVAAAAYFTWDIEMTQAERRTAFGSFEAARAAALRDAYELRASQQAYVAAGQSETYWFGKVAELADLLRAALDRISTGASASAEESVARARKAIDGFEQVDRRARTYASTGQRLLASDIIFSDGLNAAARLTAALEELGAVEADHATREAAAARFEQLKMIGGGVGAVLFVLLLLTPVARIHVPVEVAATEPETAPGADPSTDLDLKPRPQEARRPLPEPMVAAPTVEPVPTAQLEIQRLAAVCSDLARLSDTDGLPSVLERTAQALDASGLVLWVSDPEGVELVPVAAHGYPPSMLSRLGTIRSDAKNVTAAAFRTGLLQTVGANASASGAIAAPLVTPSGCRGVMSAEVRREGASQPERLAAASIIAAQLATLVGPLPAPAATERGAAL